MRARNIKPGFFLNEEIGDLNTECRLLFIGLWCLADRDGYLKYRPKRIRVEVFPYNQTFDPKVVPWLDKLAEKKLIRFYYKKEKSTTESEKNNNNEIGSDSEPLTPVTKNSKCSKGNNFKPLTPGEIPVFIEIVNFLKHQTPHRREKDSEIKPLIDGYSLGESKDSPRRPECGMRNEECGMRNEEVTGRSSTSSNPPAIIENTIMSIPLNKKNTFFDVFQEDVDEWQKTFPAVDVLSELRKARLWSVNNKKRRKTKAGIRNHLATWLGKAQDKPKPNQQPVSKTARQENIDKISALREGLEDATGFNPYKQTPESNSDINAHQNNSALPE